MAMSELDPAAKKTEAMRNVLAFLLIGAFITAMGALFAMAIPQKNEQLLTYMLGQLSGMAVTVLGFYFVNKVGQDAVDAKRADTTAKAFDAITAASSSWPSEAVIAPNAAGDAADEVAGAAKDKADQIKGE
jgi:hypothetical protein